MKKSKNKCFYCSNIHICYKHYEPSMFIFEDNGIGLKEISFEFCVSCINKICIRGCNLCKKKFIVPFETVYVYKKNILLCQCCWDLFIFSL